MNESALIADPELLRGMLVPMLAIGGMFFFGLFLLTGYSMKFALAASGVGRFGFWKSIRLVSFTGMMSLIVSVVLAFSMPNNPLAGLLAMFASVACFVIIVSISGQCGIGRAFGAYLLNGLFNVVGAVPLVGLLLVGVLAVGKSSGFDASDLENLKTQIAKAQGANEGGDGFAIDFDPFDMTKVSAPFVSSSTPKPIGNLPEQLPGTDLRNTSSSSLMDSFFTSESSSPYPTPKRSGGSQGGSGSSSRGSKSSEPVTSGLQANPFARSND